MDSLKKIVQRIEKRLEAVGLSAAGASRAAGLSTSAIYNLQRAAKGRIKMRAPNMSTLAKLAPVLRSPLPYLISGEGPEVDEMHLASEHVLSEQPSKTGLVRVVGYVGAGSEAHHYAIAQGDYEEVEAPAGSSDQTVAVEIKGQSFGPLLNTWLVFYDDVRSPITEDMYGEVCVVGLSDDRILIKKVLPQSNGRFTLVSNSKDDPDIKNVEIEWAAKVKDIRPRQ